VVIHRSYYLFCKFGPDLSKFHTERNALVVAVIWTNCRLDCFVAAYYSAHIFVLSINIEVYKIVILPVVLCGCETWLLTNILYKTFPSV